MDWLTVVASLYFSRYLVPGVSRLTGIEYRQLDTLGFIKLVTGMSVMFLLIFIWQGVYRRRSDPMALGSTRRLLRSILMGCSLMVLTGFYLHDYFDARLFVTIELFVIAFLLLFQRSLVGIAELSKKPVDPASRKILIVGTGIKPGMILNRIYGIWHTGSTALGFLTNDPEMVGQMVHPDSEAYNDRVPVLGLYEEFDQILADSNIKEVWINDNEMRKDEVERILLVCREKGVMGYLVASLGYGYDIPVEAVSMSGVIVLRQKMVPVRPLYGVAKRAFDVIVASLLLVVFLPLIVLFGILIKLDTKGPVFFKQERVGLNGRLFKMFKFRTMHTDANPYGESPERQTDPRITKFGKFLRKSSLDEVPQLINVLIGNMSLIGPRPEMQFIVDEYNQFQQIRLKVKPGMTGLWQISADRKTAIHLNMDYDIYYIDNRSLLLDMVILWKTFWTVFKGI